MQTIDVDQIVLKSLKESLEACIEMDDRPPDTAFALLLTIKYYMTHIDFKEYLRSNKILKKINKSILE